MRKKVIFIVAVFQVIIIVTISVRILHKEQRNIFGVKSLNPISSSDFISTASAELNYYYEPRANSTLVNSISLTDPLNPKAGKAEKIEYTINADSLNERFDYVKPKPEGVFRIVVLGDSITFGLYVNTRDNWTELLENRLSQYKKNALVCNKIKKIEVINLGVPGYDNRYVVERFRRRGWGYQPDLVVWMVVDMVRVSEELAPLYGKYTEEIKNSQNAVNQDKIKLNREIWDKVENSIIEKHGIEQIYKMQEDAIKSLDKFYNGKLILFATPSMPDVLRSRLKKVMGERKKGYYVDKITNFYKDSEAYFYDDGHPNKKGHEIIAQDLYDYLTNSDLIPCKEYK